MSSRDTTAEEGAVLVVVIAFMAFFAILIGAVLGFVETGLITTVKIREQGHDLYSADGAMNAAISQIDHQVVTDVARTFAAFDTDVCPAYTVPDLNGNSIEVTCVVQDDSRDFIPGGEGVDPDNTPAQALLVLGGVSGDGLSIAGNSPYPFRVEGDVASNVPLAGPATANGTFEVDGDVTATSCSGSIVVGEGDTLDCAGGAATFSDPAYASESTTALVEASVLPVCAPVVTMPPGIYRDGTALNALMRTCSAEFRFIGTYYFDFTSGCNGGNVWCINNKDATIVGGTPLYEDLTDPDRITSCGPLGAQFIFGGDSRLDVQAGDVRLCPTPHEDEQRIAIYARSPGGGGSPPVSDTATVGPTIAISGASPLWTDASDALIIDGSSASITYPRNQTASLALSGFPLDAVPAGATIDEVTMTVRHTESPPENLNWARVTVRPGDATNPGDEFVVDLGVGTGVDQQIDLTGDLTTPEEINGLSLTHAVRSKTSDLTATLDGISIDVDYTIPGSAPLGTQSGCVITGGCDVVTASGPDTNVQVLGTIYAPHSSLDLFTNNRGVEQSYRGIIARSLTLRLNPSVPTDPGVAISIPSTEGGIDGIKPAHVVLTAVLEGVDRLVADIYVDDDLTAPDAVTVDSWQVTR